MEILFVYTSLKQSDILQKSDLASHNLAGPIRLQRLYSSKHEGLYSFFYRLEDAIKLFQRIVIVLKVSSDTLSTSVDTSFGIFRFIPDSQY